MNFVSPFVGCAIRKFVVLHITVFINSVGPSRVLRILQMCFNYAILKQSKPVHHVSLCVWSSKLFRAQLEGHESTDKATAPVRVASNTYEEMQNIIFGCDAQTTNRISIGREQHSELGQISAVKAFGQSLSSLQPSSGSIIPMLITSFSFSVMSQNVVNPASSK